MSQLRPPRRPRGESARTTIRFQQRQIKELANTIALLRKDISDKEKVIAGYDVQLHEANEEIAQSRSRAAIRVGELTKARDALEKASTRLSFLEGYYEKSKERPQPVTISGSGAGNLEHFSAGRQDQGRGRQEVGSLWTK